jgi:isochorismate hydrolase
MLHTMCDCSMKNSYIGVMITVTLYNFATDLHEFLKADAATNHRSFNEHLLAILEAYRQQQLTKTEEAQPTLQISRKKSTLPL